MKPKPAQHEFHIKIWIAEARASGWGIVGLLLAIPLIALAIHMCGADLSALGSH